ncbi:hypothetical protein PLESTB_001661200 [Pleodorina starrii]|uniref:Uncharacterized protein n=1 Tax=Pleodorina starrii TaxID=330485 RepID=A0A9W6BZI5_9CHLO|nr:hypothetical protein PLESTM_001924800 [Pleodorina starrii]GLC60712.1 hypothetical protein PLESTB_001661200 [Pleodorina starrii]
MPLRCTTLVSEVAEVLDGQQPANLTEPCLDLEMLHLLCHGCYSEQLPSKEQQRITKWASSYRITVKQIDAKPVPVAPETQPNILPNAQQRRRQAAAAALDGRAVRRRVKDPVTLSAAVCEGVARYLGPGSGAQQYEVTYDNGAV